MVREGFPQEQYISASALGRILGTVRAPVVDAGEVQVNVVQGGNTLDGGPKNWATNCFRSFLIEIYEGYGSPQVGIIASNGRETVTIEGTWFKQIKVGDKYRIFGASPKAYSELVDPDHGLAEIKSEVRDIEDKLDSIFQVKAATAFSVDATNADETDILHLTQTAAVEALRLKCADPGNNAVTVRLYELVNGALTEVDSFVINGANFGEYFNLMDMFNLCRLVGDELQVTVRASAGGPYTVAGQYTHSLQGG
jgi:hypothetical protein